MLGETNCGEILVWESWKYIENADNIELLAEFQNSGWSNVKNILGYLFSRRINEVLLILLYSRSNMLTYFADREYENQELLVGNGKEAPRNGY